MTKERSHHDWRQEQMPLLERLEENTKTSRQIALLRRRFLEEEDGHGLPAVIFPLMEDAVECFVQQCIMTSHDGTQPNITHDEDYDENNDDSTITISRRRQQQQLLICGTPNMRFLERILQVHLSCAKLDFVLAEELGRQGTHAQLVRLLRLSDNKVVDLEVKFPQEEDLDAIIWIQDLAGEIAALSCGTFPVKTCPFSVETLQSRLPLSFTITSPIMDDDKIGNGDDSIIHSVEENVLIHQVCTRRQSAQEDVGFVMWPSAVVLSRWLMANPSILKLTSPLTADDIGTADGKQRDRVRILEIGAGCGLVGLLAARMIQSAKTKTTRSTDIIITTDDATASHHQPEPTCCSLDVLLSDFNPEVLENLQRNIMLNNVSDYCSVVGLDFYQQVKRRQQVEDGGDDDDTDDDTDSLSFWTDTNGTQHELVDIVLGADIICQPSDAVAAAHTIRNVLQPQTGRAIIVCASAEHRYGVDHFAQACQDVGLRVVGGMQNVKDLYHGKLLVAQQQQRGAGGNNTDKGTQDDVQQNDLNLTTGYVDNMNMTLFTIERTLSE